MIFFECFRYDSSSIIFNFLLPFGEISGEVYRGYLLSKENITKKEAINSLVIDRGSGAITLLILSIIFLPILLFLKFKSYLCFLIYFFILLFLLKLKLLIKVFKILLKIYSIITSD